MVAGSVAFLIMPKILPHMIKGGVGSIRACNSRTAQVLARYFRLSWHYAFLCKCPVHVSAKPLLRVWMRGAQ